MPLCRGSLNLKLNISQADSQDTKLSKLPSGQAEHQEVATTDKQSGLNKKQDVEKLHKRLGNLMAEHGRGAENVPGDENTTTTKKS